MNDGMTMLALQEELEKLGGGAGRPVLTFEPVAKTPCWTAKLRMPGAKVTTRCAGATLESAFAGVLAMQLATKPAPAGQ